MCYIITCIESIYIEIIYCHLKLNYTKPVCFSDNKNVSTSDAIKTNN